MSTPASLTYCLMVMLFIVTACETVIDVEVPPYESQLVPQAFFTQDSLWAVQVSQSVDFTSANEPEFVENARVQIWQNGDLLETLVRSDSGLYTSRQNIPIVDEIYTLRVEAPGFDGTEGTDQVPRPLNVGSFASTISLPDSSQPGLRREVNVTLTLNDEPGKANFYGLFVIQARVREDRSTGSITPFPPSIFFFESSNPAFDESEFDFLDNERSFFQEAFFDDVLFDGEAYPIDLTFSYDVSDPRADLQIHRAFAVVLLSVSEHFYLYWKTANKQYLTNENPFAEPLRVHSNMTGGLGVFAGFQYSIYPASVDTLALNNICDRAQQLQPVCESLLDTAPINFLQFP